MQMPSAAAGKDRFGVHRLRETPVSSGDVEDCTASPDSIEMSAYG